jgi:4-amino-4-deoxy-L-arabinose transferase-like glycosyltransferase
MAGGIVLGLTLFRLWFCTHHELVPDEAYYWLWAKHLDWCYRDKGPLVAWLIAMGTGIAGDNVFGVRWTGVLLGGGTAWQLYSAARRLFDERIAGRVLVLACLVPLFAIGSILMTIDSPSVFLWALGLNLAWKSVTEGRRRDWLLFGLVIGLGVLAKFTNILQLASFGLFLLLQPERRRLLWSGRMITCLTMVGLCLVPMLWWNMVHQWPNAGALSSRSGIDAGFHLHPGEFGKFLEEQFLVTSPLLYLVMLGSVLGLFLTARKEVRILFLLCDFLPITLTFAFFSLNAAGKGNWTAPALISGLILTVVGWERWTPLRKNWKRGVMVVTLLVATVETVAVHETSWLHLKSDPLKRIRGWSDLADRTQVWRTRLKPSYLIGNHYSQSSILAFYLSDHPVTYTPTDDGVANQFDLWPGYQVREGETALYITDEMDEMPDVFKKEFKQVELVDDFFTQWDTHPVRRFKIFYCHN